jgi:hypothetical protein
MGNHNTILDFGMLSASNRLFDNMACATAIASKYLTQVCIHSCSRRSSTASMPDPVSSSAPLLSCRSCCRPVLPAVPVLVCVLACKAVRKVASPARALVAVLSRPSNWYRYVSVLLLSCACSFSSAFVALGISWQGGMLGTLRGGAGAVLEGLDGG